MIAFLFSIPLVSASLFLKQNSFKIPNLLSGKNKKRRKRKIFFGRGLWGIGCRGNGHGELAVRRKGERGNLGEGGKLGALPHRDTLNVAVVKGNGRHLRNS